MKAIVETELGLVSFTGENIYWETNVGTLRVYVDSKLNGEFKVWRSVVIEDGNGWTLNTQPPE